MQDRARGVREAILERVFPELRYGGDPDIERYFELRASGKMLDALSVYRARLRPRYPDDAKRIVLLKLYRTRSPEFSEYLRGLLYERADEIIVRLRGNLDALVAPLAGVSMRDTYAVLKAVERVARLLPDDADEARRTAWNYADYAKLLSHRVADAERAAYLLGEFYDQATVDDDAPTDFIAASLATEESRRRRERDEEKKNFFDLAKIEFDRADVLRIEIPSGIERDEDVVLAYCHKYWLRVEDPAFERIVWLYSRKYGTKHYEVFKAVKTGRRKKYQDDDILTMVSSAIATRYNYTVQGDLYMQAAWRRIKAGLYAVAAPQQKAPQKTAPREAAPRQKARQQSAPREATPRQAAPRAKPSRRPVITAGKPPRARANASAAAIKTRSVAVPASIPQKRAPAGQSERKLVRAQAPAPLRREKPLRDAVPELIAAGSISDQIKRLSGRAYDVYKEIFLSRVGSHIRAALLQGRTKSGATFGEDANTAENIIHDFMERNYSNAYMSWDSSEHRARIRGLGFDLENLDGIIESCYRKIGK